MPRHKPHHVSIPLPDGQIVTQIDIDGPFLSAVYRPNALVTPFQFALDTSFNLTDCPLKSVANYHPFHSFFEPDPYPTNTEHTHWVTSNFHTISSTPLKVFCAQTSKEASDYVFGKDGCQIIIDTLDDNKNSLADYDPSLFFWHLVNDYMYSLPNFDYGIWMSAILEYRGYNDIQDMCQLGDPKLENGCDALTTKAIRRFFFFYSFLPAVFAKKVLIPVGKATYHFWKKRCTRCKKTNTQSPENG